MSIRSNELQTHTPCDCSVPRTLPCVSRRQWRTGRVSPGRVVTDRPPGYAPLRQMTVSESPCTFHHRSGNIGLRCKLCEPQLLTV